MTVVAGFVTGFVKTGDLVVIDLPKRKRGNKTIYPLSLSQRIPGNVNPGAALKVRDAIEILAEEERIAPELKGEFRRKVQKSVEDFCADHQQESSDYALQRAVSVLKITLAVGVLAVAFAAATGELSISKILNGPLIEKNAPAPPMAGAVVSQRDVPR
jgi:hypothetical protein